MTISTARLRQAVQAFDFRQLFITELNWNNYKARLPAVTVDSITYRFTSIAEQGGMVVVVCEASDGAIPLTGTQRKIDKHITELAYEHIIIFIDGERSTALWWWVKREDGKSKPRTHTYRAGQMGDALLQKLAGIAFTIEELDEEGRASIATVTGKVRKVFDVETVTKKFYKQFETEHTNFLDFLRGVQDATQRDWYISVMLNRLMFLYFIQRKGFLNGDRNYLQTKLVEMQQQGKPYYRDFLLKLFFEGLATEAQDRSTATNRLLGQIPYLNGGLFLPHQIEETYGDQLDLADDAFARLFNFFDSYTWHLDERPLQLGNEINPDVLGYIFEKYINNKQMGAYYTKEDITTYICRNTILPHLLDKVGVNVSNILHDVEPYIYDAVSTTDYLPTETEREYNARRQRYAQIKADFAAGKIATVNDLITYNLDLQAFTEDWLRGLQDRLLLRRFYFDCLTKLTVLDPTCGSGAFLFAAMNILEPLYELALDRLKVLQDPKFPDFAAELARVNQHPNRRYFVFKSIIINNLYGVDIMPEAVEICKLRLFLKLVAQIEEVRQIEPLPDIDFNIRAGNTLIGFATQGEISGRLFATDELLGKVAEVDRALQNFRALQTRLSVSAGLFKQTKQDIQARLATIRTELDTSLRSDYGQRDLAAFRRSHQPFHWYVEFNHVVANGGFDVIVGNPPYVEMKDVQGYTVRGYSTAGAGDLYACVTEKAFDLVKANGRVGLIVPISIFGTDGFKSLQQFVLRNVQATWVSCFSNRPSQLFIGAQKRLTILLATKGLSGKPKVFTTSYLRWKKEERDHLLDTRLNYVYSSVPFRVFPASLEKFGSELEISAFSKLLAKKDRLEMAYCFFRET